MIDKMAEPLLAFDPAAALPAAEAAPCGCWRLRTGVAGAYRRPQDANWRRWISTTC